MTTIRTLLEAAALEQARQKESLCALFCAETGLRPSQCELVEDSRELGTVTWSVRATGPMSSGSDSADQRKLQQVEDSLSVMREQYRRVSTLLEESMVREAQQQGTIAEAQNVLPPTVLPLSIGERITLLQKDTAEHAQGLARVLSEAQIELGNTKVDLIRSRRTEESLRKRLSEQDYARQMDARYVRTVKWRISEAFADGQPASRLNTLSQRLP